MTSEDRVDDERAGEERVGEAPVGEALDVAGVRDTRATVVTLAK